MRYATLCLLFCATLSSDAGAQWEQLDASSAKKLLFEAKLLLREQAESLQTSSENYVLTHVSIATGASPVQFHAINHGPFACQANTVRCRVLIDADHVPPVRGERSMDGRKVCSCRHSFSTTLWEKADPEVPKIVRPLTSRATKNANGELTAGC